MQDRRRQIWIEAGARHWPDLDTLNAWLASECAPLGRCRRIRMPPTSPWPKLWRTKPLWPHLMRDAPAPFDGYIERPVRVEFDRAGQLPAQPLQRAVRTRPRRRQPARVSLRTGRGGRRGRGRPPQPSFERDQVHYDWQHYIALVRRKPGHCVTARRSCPCPIRCSAAGVAAPASRRPPWPRCWPPYPCRLSTSTGGGGALESGGARRPRAQRAGAIAASGPHDRDGRLASDAASSAGVHVRPATTPRADHVDA